MSFSTPLALALVAVLPLFAWLGWPSRTRQSGREWASLVVRCLIALLLILGLAGAQVARAADQMAVVFLLDVSDSVAPEERLEAEEWVRQALLAMAPQDRAAVIVFGAEALVERPLSSVSELAPLTSVPRSLGTDIEGAIRLALALIPAGSAGRLVIVSDGLETSGAGARAARLAGASGVPIEFRLIPRRDLGPEALLTSIAGPTRLAEGDRFSLEVTTQSNRPMRAVLQVIARGQVVHQEVASLAAGENRHSISLAASEPGFARYLVQLIPAEDTFHQNNQLSAYTEISGQPRVLVVSAGSRGGNGDEPAGDESDALALALLSSGLAVDRVTGRQLPHDFALLSEYEAVILVNVSASELNPRRLAALETYVRDLGGGLVVVGGPESYAPGGYFRTALERTLPVEMQLKDQERWPNLSMVYVIDKSGSMADTSVGGVPKVELAKEAVIRSLGLLGPMDRAGVVAFDGSAFWVVPSQELTDPDNAADLVGGLRASGGTDIYAGLQAVAQAVPEDPATLKHVILLTDGGANEAGSPEITRMMHEDYGVTLSVVAIGEGYAEWITGLPEIADGRFHFAYDPATIPEIFTQETSLATRAYITEEQFWPRLVQDHPILSGIDAVPPLLGYIGSTAKPAAQTLLVTHLDDPLLAAWHYGLGKSVAWTSDATGRWAAEWVTWTGFSRFWEQAVKWSISQQRGANAELEVVLEDGQALVTLLAQDAQGDSINGLEPEARVVTPGNRGEDLIMRQVAPGRYEGNFVPKEEGAYLIRVSAEATEGTIAQTAGWALTYSPEYRLDLDSAVGAETLEQLATLTGGGALIEPWECWSRDLEPPPGVRRPLWGFMALVAVALLPIDVAIRRLVLGHDQVLKARTWLSSRVPGRHGRRVPAARAEPVSRLLEAKRRADAERVGVRQPMISDVPTEMRLDEVDAGRGSGLPGETLAERLLEGKRKRRRHNDS